MTPEFWMGIAGITGTALGVVITSCVHLKTEKLRHSAQINEKILDNRIEAHLALARITPLFTSVAYIEREKTAGVDIPYPAFFIGHDAFEAMQLRWSKINRGLKIWCHLDLHKELNYIDNYWSNLTKEVEKISKENLPSLGSIVIEDFDNFEKSLNTLLKDFFQREIYNINSKDFGELILYSEGEKIQRLSSTQLRLKKQTIEALYKTGGNES